MSKFKEITGLSPTFKREIQSCSPSVHNGFMDEVVFRVFDKTADNI